MKSIDFFYSIGSRYSYLAQSQVAALERDFGVATRWLPLRSGQFMRAETQRLSPASRPQDGGE